ncbi:MAG TPA: 30S ribosomal protein S17 [SAR86 cluster bacterium]|jgi:small subunit ribosomal protein S17|nr:30S ribosomal protein S17 [SAR86 cluster bacterium]HJM15212.1 30S ribosomal protein S17 [SAR86 cluster bacterium]|tara:strand:+ start:2691 stop:2954 length:264 start_codon:yes stop_codon:yes gene_type:complete
MTEINTRTQTGLVVSSKRDKTITVMVERKVKHPLYKKILRRSSKLQAHDQDNACNEGDLVTIQECKPLSKTKSWELLKVEKKVQEIK